MGEQVDVLVIGAGVTGLYQLYVAREAGFSVKVLEAGAGEQDTVFAQLARVSRRDDESLATVSQARRWLFFGRRSAL